MSVRREFIRRVGQQVMVVTVAGFETGPVRIVDAIEADDVASVQFPDGSAGVLALDKVFLVKDVVEDSAGTDFQHRLPLG